MIEEGSNDDYAKLNLSVSNPVVKNLIELKYILNQNQFTTSIATGV